MARQRHSVGHQIKRPSKTTRRASFAILRLRYDLETGARLSCKTLTAKEDKATVDAIAAINLAYQRGQYGFAKCDELMVEIKDRLNADAWKRETKVVHCQDNLRLLDEFFERDYERRDVEKESLDCFRWSCERAIEAVGTLSLYTATIEDIQGVINRKFRDAPAKQREAVDRLNTLLRFAGRVTGKHDKLKRVRKPSRRVPHVSEEELKELLPHLPDDNYRILARASFGTGTRVGELFALTLDCVVGNQLIVNEQVKRTGDRRDPKRGKKRMAYVTSEGKQALAEFFMLEPEVRSELRSAALAKILAAACRAAMPKRSDKHICWHDLRHSYAIHLIRKGVPLTLVAQSLGNSVQVCQEYYAGYSLTNETVQTIARIMGDG